MAGGLLTDLYELNMAASYLRRGMTGLATFSLFVRQLPADRGFLVAAGLEDCLRFLAEFSFTGGDLDYLRREQGYGEDALRAFGGLRFTGEVWAVPEGRVVFAGVPLLEVTAPVAEAQLAETVLLNHVTFQTSVATKAARCVLAAGGAQLVDFSFRRTQGIGAGLSVARASAIAGFAATSNVGAARRFGLAAAGTMAHSFIEAFADEERAFTAFAEDFPGRTTFLVDTYDTGRGVRTAIEVARRLQLAGPAGVRLDSGDLAGLARSARRRLPPAALAAARPGSGTGPPQRTASGTPGPADARPEAVSRPSATLNGSAACGVYGPITSRHFMPKQSPTSRRRGCRSRQGNPPAHRTRASARRETAPLAVLLHRQWTPRSQFVTFSYHRSMVTTLWTGRIPDRVGRPGPARAFSLPARPGTVRRARRYWSGFTG